MGEEFYAAIGHITALGTVIVVFGGAATYVWKGILNARNRLKRDTDRHDEQIKAMHQKCDDHCAHVDECLDRDNQRINQLEESNPLILRGIKQLITHELDGNHVDKLEEVRDDIDDYLIKRR